MKYIFRFQYQDAKKISKQQLRSQRYLKLFLAFAWEKFLKSPTHIKAQLFSDLETKSTISVIVQYQIPRYYNSVCTMVCIGVCGSNLMNECYFVLGSEFIFQ